MNTRLEIPGHELLVTRTDWEGSNLVVRLTSEIHPETVSTAYRLECIELQEPETALQFLKQVLSDKTFVYVSWRSELLVFSTEHGDELLISAKLFEASAVPIATEEVAEALQRVYGWYLSAHEASSRANSKLQRVGHLLTDQANRIRSKSGSHTPESVAGVLYSQQLSFIARLLRESEA